MPLGMQVKLLRVIQERKITRIGGNNTFDIDVRLITATNKDLLKNSDLGQFRKDLYYRINVLNINLPPLRERKSDIKELVDFFIHKMSSKLNKKVNGISQEALMILEQYDWYGKISNAARLLNITRNTVYNKMKKYNIQYI